MQLPDSNSITLPETNYEHFAISDEDFLAEWDIDTLKTLIPAYARTGTDALRDAMLKAWARMSNRQKAETTRIFAAQQSPRHAWGFWLDAWGEEKHQRRLPTESDSDYRERLLEEIIGITPASIREAVIALLTPRFAPKTCVFVEPKRDFAWRASTSWATTAPHCFRQSRTAGHGRIWASGRRTGLRTAGAYRVRADAPPQLWVFVQSTLSSAKGCVGKVSGVDPTVFVGRATGANPYIHTVVISNASAEIISKTVRALALRVLYGVQWMIIVEPALPYSIVR